MKKSLITIAILSSCCALQGCVFVAGAAAGAGATAVATDNRSVQSRIIDNRIELAISNKISKSTELADDSHIVITSFNAVVLITGQTPTPDLKQQVAQIVQSTPEVKHVYNELTIGEPVSTSTSAKDLWISAKINAQLLATKTVQSDLTKVISENGIVYLMGKVSRHQAAMAVAIARRTEGVKKVIKVFQYVDSATTTQPNT